LIHDRAAQFRRNLSAAHEALEQGSLSYALTAVVSALAAGRIVAESAMQRLTSRGEATSEGGDS
jgi:hypothetical protein